MSDGLCWKCLELLEQRCDYSQTSPVPFRILHCHHEPKESPCHHVFITDQNIRRCYKCGAIAEKPKCWCETKSYLWTTSQGHLPEHQEYEYIRPNYCPECGGKL